MNEIIVILQQEPPETPDHFELVSFSSRTANFTWIKPYDGKSSILKYIIEFETDKYYLEGVFTTTFELKKGNNIQLILRSPLHVFLKPKI